MPWLACYAAHLAKARHGRGLAGRCTICGWFLGQLGSTGPEITSAVACRHHSSRCLFTLASAAMTEGAVNGHLCLYTAVPAPTGQTCCNPNYAGRCRS